MVIHNMEYWITRWSGIGKNGIVNNTMELWIIWRNSESHDGIVKYTVELWITLLNYESHHNSRDGIVTRNMEWATRIPLDAN